MLDLEIEARAPSITGQDGVEHELCVRLVRTMRSQFLVEVTSRGGVADLSELNVLFEAWVEVVYHHNVHSETGHTPIERFFREGPPRLPTPAELHEAFLWSALRTVSKTAQVSLYGNSFEVDAALVGRRVELVFNPFDLTDIDVRYDRRPMGKAIAVRIGRHVHPKARTEAVPPPVPTGIDYLGLVRKKREAELLGRRIDYAGLDAGGEEVDEERRPTRGPPKTNGKERCTMSIESIRSHYGFSRAPFGKDIPPQQLHAHRGHQEAVARISYCITEKMIGVITGECGSGKSVAARAAVASLDGSRHTTIYLGTPGVGLRGIYCAIVSGLGAVPRFHAASLIPQTQDLIAAESAERGKTLVIVCDEVHLLPQEALEGLRCLSNDDGMDAGSRFALLLLAQPTFRRRLRLGAFAALDQRVGLRYGIAPLDAAECASYIAQHLKFAGRSDPLFSDDAVLLIHQVSRGLPRVVNNLATQSLVAAFSSNKGIVDESSARDAVAEVTAE